MDEVLRFRNLGMSKSAVLSCALILIVASLLASCSLRPELASEARDTATSPSVFTSPTPFPAPTSVSPTAAEIVAQGEDVPFDVCGGVSTWVRPSEEQQASRIWEFGRYAGMGADVLEYLWTHDFFVNYGSASVEQDMRDLSGLWTLPAGVRATCFEQARQDAILQLRMAEVWVLFHTVKEIRRVGTSYTVIVEPVEQGVQFVQFPRPERQLPLTLYFVTQEGHEIDKVEEADYWFWPYPHLVPTMQP
jgi:hypothetical protein